MLQNTLSAEIASRIKFVKDTRSLVALQRIIFIMEGAVVHKTMFNKQPFMMHGLLGKTAEDVEAYHRDTSFGFYGFTLGTFGQMIRFLRDFQVSHYTDMTAMKTAIPEAYSEEIEALKEDQKRLGLRIPDSQTHAFITFILSYHNMLEKNRVMDKVLSKEEKKWIVKSNVGYKSLSNEDKMEFEHIAHFYKVWNGELISKTKGSNHVDSHKLKRLFSTYERFKEWVNLDKIGAVDGETLAADGSPVELSDA